jgi:hypothetical protein
MRVRLDSADMESRGFYGIGTSSDPTSSDTAATAFVGFRQTNTAGLTNWYGIASTGAVQSSVDLGTAPTAGQLYILRFRYDAAANVVYFYINGSYTGQLASPSGLPSTTTFYRSRLILRTLNGSIHTVRLMHCGILQL